MSNSFLGNFDNNNYQMSPFSGEIHVGCTYKYIKCCYQYGDLFSLGDLLTIKVMAILAISPLMLSAIL